MPFRFISSITPQIDLPITMGTHMIDLDDIFSCWSTPP